MPTQSTIIKPNSFEPENHWYDKAINSTIHPMVMFFLNLDVDTIVYRYCHLNPKVDAVALKKILKRPMKYFKWAGADLINVTTEDGKRQMVIIENNSCPSGQKSMPLLNDQNEAGGYKEMLSHAFLPLTDKKLNKMRGGLAMIYDKNPMETSGYAAMMAELTNEPVHFIPYYENDKNPGVKWEDGVLYVYGEDDQWHRIRACMRYLTQRPWNRIPIQTKTKVLNPIITCLAGGRNKLVAAKAYNLYNADISDFGLKIKTPETIWDVRKNEIPLWVKRMGGHAVIKIPYSNAGQGVFTIVNEYELDQFMSKEYNYDRFIVQSLIGNYNWTSRTTMGKFYHVGTVPNKKMNTYVADIRMMICSTAQGFKPIGMYARRARKPLPEHLDSGEDSWNILGTNLSIKESDGSWSSDTTRLMLADRRDFNKLGLSLDDLIEAYIQTILSTTAIDNMSKQLFNPKGGFKKRLFKSLNDDESLISEIVL